MTRSDNDNTDHGFTTALVCLTPKAEPAWPIRRVHPNSSFVAQLIATAADFPPTRQRRRAAPNDAVLAYAGTAASGRAGLTRRIA